MRVRLRKKRRLILAVSKTNQTIKERNYSCKKLRIQWNKFQRLTALTYLQISDRLKKIY